MPSTITHAFIGLDTIKKLDTKPKDIINSRIKNFKVYCQSTDILYFYRILLLKHNKIQEVGHRFHHEHVFDSFNLLIEDNKRNKDLELFTLIAGFITHYQADSIIHPYIDSFTDYNNESKRFNKHFEIETYLDNYFVNTRLDSNHKLYNNTNFVFDYEEKDYIKELLSILFLKYFNIKNVGEKYYQALREMKFVFDHIRYDKYGIKRFLYQIIDLNPFNIKRTKYLSYHFDLDKIDEYLNIDHNEWSKNGIISNKSFFDLYDEVIDNASYIINELYQYIFEDKDIDTKKLVKNNDYSSGLEISPNK